MTRLSALAAITTVASSDILHVASDPGGANLDKKITFANFKLALLEGGIVVNEGGADVDFRIEGDTDANLFFVDASTGLVGVGLSSPQSKLHIISDDSSNNSVVNVLRVEHNTTGSAANGLGTGILFGGESSTTASQAIGQVRAYWTDVTHASRKSGMILSVYDGGSPVDVVRMLTNGSATGYVGIMTPPNTSYVLDVLTNARISGANPALYLYDTIQGDSKRIIIQMDATNNLGVIQTTYGTGGVFPLVIKVVNEEVARFNGAEITFNEEGNDNDFRVEGDTDANLFFTDAGNDRVGIGMNNPAQKLDVTGNVKFGAASGAAGSRIIARGEHTSAPAGTLSAGEWELSVYDDGASPVFRIRYNDGGVEKTGNVTLA